MKRRNSIFLSLMLIFSVACSQLNVILGGGGEAPVPAPLPVQTEPTTNPLPLQPIIEDDLAMEDDAVADEPVLVTGTIPFTSAFFIDTVSEPFVLLQDQSGFVERDASKPFALIGQTIGPVELVEDGLLTYSLQLPAGPQGVLKDVDQDGEKDSGVMVFAVAYWMNIWGGPFLEEREGAGWSTSYVSTATDPDRGYEINGGHLIIWAPDGEQSFPSGFGADGMLFTEDDPIQDVLAGYSIVDLNEEPFRVYKEANAQITLIEGDLAVNDYSTMSLSDAFDTMFAKVAVEYPFTVEKNIDWQALYDKHAPIVSSARSEAELYRALQNFTYDIPDAHVGLDFNEEVFFEDRGGSFGMLLAEVSGGPVIVSKVFPGYAADVAGIQAGAEIITWDGQPVKAALDAVVPYLGPYSTAHSKRLGQLLFLTRMPVGENIKITYKNPNGAAETVSLYAGIEYESLFEALGYSNQYLVELPVEAEILESGIGYIRINTFADDYTLMVRLWERHIQSFVDNEVPALILDMRSNPGGIDLLAMGFASYFFDEAFSVSESLQYSELTGEFEVTGASWVGTGPIFYDGDVAVLIGPNCASACELFANALTQESRAIMVGSYPTNGAAGGVRSGQYILPYGISMQFPTVRLQTMDGEVLIEGEGVKPFIVVPITAEGALGVSDPVLDAAVTRLLRD
jgi:C-terminal processing protease CtpA/Prc